MGGLIFLALQDYINVLKSEGRMWNPAIAVVLFPLSIPQGNGFSLGPRKREVLGYKLHAVMLQAFWVGLEMERRNGMAVLICPQGTPLYDCEFVNIASQ